MSGAQHEGPTPDVAGGGTAQQGNPAEEAGLPVAEGAGPTTGPAATSGGAPGSAGAPAGTGEGNPLEGLVADDTPEHPRDEVTPEGQPDAGPVHRFGG
ncbi:MAG: hypothetical protein M3Q27_17865 [Actinomycetota bacterium]|nr:hypothetical protein [Actinomycetota bacterium]